MSREYKFRVYSFVDKEFIYFDIYDYPQGIAGGVSEPQQYTGFKDADGNEIYEGDILKNLTPTKYSLLNGESLSQVMIWVLVVLDLFCLGSLLLLNQKLLVISLRTQNY
jgi:hypothetical protein